MGQIPGVIIHRTRKSVAILQVKDSHTEWGDGRVSISEFLSVSEGGHQYEIFCLSIKH